MRWAAAEEDVRGQEAATMWDVIVIGAGPAGALAAREAALAGWTTLLVDAKTFPRPKVCGGYLNFRALAALRRAGLAQVLQRSAASPVQHLQLTCGRQKVHFPLPAGRIVCRSTFDSLLLDEVGNAGALVLTGCPAIVEPTLRDGRRVVVLSQHGRSTAHCARVVVVADGLTRSSVRHLPEFVGSAVAGSRVGVGAVMRADTNVCPRDQIKMIVSRGGYVGMSRIDDARINIAAAIAPAMLADACPANAVTAILEQSRANVPDGIRETVWRGTPRLTSRPRQVASERIFLIGDAAGYVEPFTGEGMAAAIESGLAVMRFVRQAAVEWNQSLASGWASLHRGIVCDRQATSRRLAWTMRRPWLAATALGVCRVIPALAERIIVATSRPSNFEWKHFQNPLPMGEGDSSSVVEWSPALGAV